MQSKLDEADAKMTQVQNEQTVQLEAVGQLAREQAAKWDQLGGTMTEIRAGQQAQHAELADALKDIIATTQIKADQQDASIQEAKAKHEELSLSSSQSVKALAAAVEDSVSKCETSAAALEHSLTAQQAELTAAMTSMDTDHEAKWAKHERTMNAFELSQHESFQKSAKQHESRWQSLESSISRLREQMNETPRTMAHDSSKVVDASQFAATSVETERLIRTLEEKLNEIEDRHEGYKTEQRTQWADSEEAAGKITAELQQQQGATKAGVEKLEMAQNEKWAEFESSMGDKKDEYVRVREMQHELQASVVEQQEKSDAYQQLLSDLSEKTNRLSELPTVLDEYTTETESKFSSNTQVLKEIAAQISHLETEQDEKWEVNDGSVRAIQSQQEQHSVALEAVSAEHSASVKAIQLLSTTMDTMAATESDLLEQTSAANSLLVEHTAEFVRVDANIADVVRDGESQQQTYNTALQALADNTNERVGDINQSVAGIRNIQQSHYDESIATAENISQAQEAKWAKNSRELDDMRNQQHAAIQSQAQETQLTLDAHTVRMDELSVQQGAALQQLEQVTADFNGKFVAEREHTEVVRASGEQQLGYLGDKLETMITKSATAFDTEQKRLDAAVAELKEEESTHHVQTSEALRVEVQLQETKWTETEKALGKIEQERLRIRDQQTALRALAMEQMDKAELESTRLTELKTEVVGKFLVQGRDLESAVQQQQREHVQHTKELDIVHEQQRVLVEDFREKQVGKWEENSTALAKVQEDLLAQRSAQQTRRAELDKAIARQDQLVEELQQQLVQTHSVAVESSSSDHTISEQDLAQISAHGKSLVQLKFDHQELQRELGSVLETLALESESKMNRCERMVQVAAEKTETALGQLAVSQQALWVKNTTAMDDIRGEQHTALQKSVDDQQGALAQIRDELSPHGSTHLALKQLVDAQEEKIKACDKLMAKLRAEQQEQQSEVNSKIELVEKEQDNRWETNCDALELLRSDHDKNATEQADALTRMARWQQETLGKYDDHLEGMAKASEKLVLECAAHSKTLEKHTTEITEVQASIQSGSGTPITEESLQAIRESISAQTPAADAGLSEEMAAALDEMGKQQNEKWEENAQVVELIRREQIAQNTEFTAGLKSVRSDSQSKWEESVGAIQLIETNQTESHENFTRAIESALEAQITHLRDLDTRGEEWHQELVDWQAGQAQAWVEQDQKWKDNGEVVDLHSEVGKENALSFANLQQSTDAEFVEQTKNIETLAAEQQARTSDLSSLIESLAKGVEKKWEKHNHALDELRMHQYSSIQIHAAEQERKFEVQKEELGNAIQVRQTATAASQEQSVAEMLAKEKDELKSLVGKQQSTLKEQQDMLQMLREAEQRQLQSERALVTPGIASAAPPVITLGAEFSSEQAVSLASATGLDTPPVPAVDAQIPGPQQADEEFSADPPDFSIDDDDGGEFGGDASGFSADAEPTPLPEAPSADFGVDDDDDDDDDVEDDEDDEDDEDNDAAAAETDGDEGSDDDEDEQDYYDSWEQQYVDEQTALGVEHIQGLSTALQGTSNIPQQNSGFVGRRQQLGEIGGVLSSGDSLNVVAVSGASGVGKTDLVLEYVHRHFSSYLFVWWLDAESEAHLQMGYSSLAQHMGVDSGGTLEEVCFRVQWHLAQIPGWCLLFDNAGHPDELAPYLPRDREDDELVGHILITTKAGGFGGYTAIGEATQLSLGGFAEEESVQLLLQETGESDAQAALVLALALGNLPVAVTNAASYIKKEASISLQDYTMSFVESAESAESALDEAT
jgi:hypothetical protein